MSLEQPLLPFTRPTLGQEEIQAVVQVLQSGWITTGPQTSAFEKELSDYFGGRPVRCFNSGTATLEVALRIAGVGPGDEVITTPLSWVATANVILTVGAIPVFVDVDPVTRNLDARQIESAITDRTKAIIPVHLAGLPCDLERIYALAKAHRLRVIEDAAQAIDSQFKGQRIGTVGDLVSFSFHANKNLTTTEGGCLVLNSEEEAQLASKYRLQGVVRTGLDGMDVDVLGGKFNMTDVAAAIGREQLKKLSRFTQARKRLARLYFEHLKTVPALKNALPVEDFEHSNWHMFQLVLPQERTREDFMAFMKARNIVIGVHYPAIHLFSLYRSMGFTPGQFPNAERIGARIVTLPLFPTQTDDEVQRVVDAISSYFNTGSDA